MEELRRWEEVSSSLCRMQQALGWQPAPQHLSLGAALTALLYTDMGTLALETTQEAWAESHPTENSQCGLQPSISSAHGFSYPYSLLHLAKLSNLSNSYASCKTQFRCPFPEAGPCSLPHPQALGGVYSVLMLRLNALPLAPKPDLFFLFFLFFLQHRLYFP